MYFVRLTEETALFIGAIVLMNGSETVNVMKIAGHLVAVMTLVIAIRA